MWGKKAPRTYVNQVLLVMWIEQKNKKKTIETKRLLRATEKKKLETHL